jgi:hypothetical protein
VAAYACLDRMEEAKAALKRLREISPHTTIERIVASGGRHNYFGRLLPGLRKAGLPER